METNELVDDGVQRNGPEGSAYQDPAPLPVPPAPAGGSNSSVDPPAPATPAPAPAAPTAGAPAQPAAPAAQPAGTPPATAPGGAQPPGQSAAPQTWENARAYAAHLGLAQAGQFQDDTSFLQALVAEAQQAQTYQQQLHNLAQERLAYQQQVMALRGAQPPAQPAAPPDPLKGVWNPPEYNAAWEGLVTRDDKGNLTLKPGASPDILPKYLNYQQYRREFADKLLSNPVQTLQPMVEHVAAQRVEAMLNERMGAIQNESYAQQFVRDNANWLHAKDAIGRVLRDPVSGQPQLTAAGARFQQYVVQAERLGIRDIRQQEQYARGFLTRDIQAEQLQQYQGQQQANQQLTQANRRPNVGGSVPAPGLPGSPPPPPQNPALSLRDQLAQAFAANGITDASFADPS